MLKIIINTLSSFMFEMFMSIFHYKHKYVIVYKYYKDNSIPLEQHSISAFVRYKCKICGDIYTKCVYKAEVCTETSHNRVITMLQKQGFIQYLDTLN